MKSSWLIFILLMPLTSAAFAQQPQPIDQNLRIIQMDGHGEAHANPDQASVSFAIETKGSTAQEAGAQNAQIAQKVIAALKSKVGAGGKVETGSYSLSPLFATTSAPRFKSNGWSAWNTISVECDPSIAGGLLDELRAAGAEGTSDTDSNSGNARIDVQVKASALTANEAGKKCADKAREVVDKIKGKLGGKGTVKIEQGRVQAENEQVNNQFNDQTQEIIGYQASNLVSVETGAIDQVGSLIDTAIAAGAMRANFVTFNLRDDSKARSDAIADACKDAQLKANAAAQALGLKVKRVMKVVSVGDFRPQPVGYSAAVQGSVSGTTPIRPGEISVPAMVTVTYELE
jgi:uncharacterized protein YggE